MRLFHLIVAAVAIVILVVGLRLASEVGRSVEFGPQTEIGTACVVYVGGPTECEG